ncbi:hypothetical protein DSM112329_00169 [Paraconexibacter sp. AEG42_29]|uniref:Type IV secretory system conjugative DNA transfer family protein n=1 Tax=Paraconexibacter sp. AEG42_29 TaxID=2997339 RepID=A0AAU7ANX8_9ACTN
MTKDEQDRLALHLLLLTAVATGVGALLYLLLAAVTLLASGQLPPLTEGIVGMAQVPWHAGDPAAAFDPTTARLLPGAAWFWLTLATVMLTGLGAAGWLALRVDRARGRRVMALRPYDPRRRITPRAFARPRDLRHMPAGVPDSWSTIRLDGRMIGTAPQSHILLIAPTRSGKTTGPVTAWTLEHQGPAVVTSTKIDIVALTAGARLRHGPVWIYGPGVPDDALPLPACGWTPLDGCATWEGAQMMARWLAANTTGGSDVQESDGGRFYNKEAGRVLAALLHAAKLAGRDMLTVNRWLRREDAEPLRLLRTHGADLAAETLDAFRKTDTKPRSLTIATCGQLIDAYEFASVQASDYSDFSPSRLLDGGT